MQKESDKERYYRRVQERHFWVRFGVLLLVSCSSLFVISTIISFIINIPFPLYYNLVGVTFTGMILGALFSLFLARLGWSKSKLLDLLFNRVSIVLIIISPIWAMMQISIWRKSVEETNYTIAVLVVGIILNILGMRFHSPIVEDFRVKSNSG
ncbi:MAG: hypothetical protein HS114_01345 [Anaerolineales bacterium]|nr:hypothetical protein [Anaerolineales bacterium]